MQHQTPLERAVATYCPGWQVTPADQVGSCRVNPETLNGDTPAEQTFRYIDIGSVHKGVIDWPSIQTIRFSDAPSRARRVVRPGDVLLCTVRPLLESHASATWKEQEGYVCSTGFAVIRPDGRMKPDFLRHLPFCEQVTHQLVAWQCGTNYPAVNERDVRKLRLPLPSAEEQIAVSCIFNAVDAALERTQDAVEQSRHLKHAVLQRFFYDALGETAYADRPRRKLPRGWSLIPTHQLLDEEPKNGVSPEASTQPPGTPTFSIAAIRDGRIDLENREHLKYARVAEKVAQRYQIRRGDVLIVRGNANPDLVGKAGIVGRFPDKCIYPDIAKRVVFRSEGQPRVSPDFAVLAWNHAVVHNQVLRRAKTSNGTLKINNRDVNQIVMPVPPDSEQSELVRKATAVDALQDALVDVCNVQQQLKRSLMHDFLTGRVSLTTVKEMVAS